MNRLQYWMRARTRYSIHSPFLYSLYGDVLFASVARQVIPRCSGETRTHYRYRTMVYKFVDRFGMKSSAVYDGLTELAGEGAVTHAVVLCGPHRSAVAERQWAYLCADNRFNLAVDLFDVALVMRNDRVPRQQWVLR